MNEDKVRRMMSGMPESAIQSYMMQQKQTKALEEQTELQKQQVEIWDKMFQKQQELLYLQAKENNKTARNNFILSIIVGLATVAQAVFACLEFFHR